MSVGYDLKALVDRYLATTKSGGAIAQGPIARSVIAAVSAPPPAIITDATTAEQARHMPQAVYEDGRYGDIVTQLVQVPAGADIIALQRPKFTRVFLLLFNPTLANLYVGFDTQSSIGALPIPPGGNLFFDAFVPQNDIHLFAAAASAIPLLYANQDIIST